MNSENANIMDFPIIRTEHISYEYSIGKFAIHNISLSIFKGDKVAILGANGAGKSTFLLHLNGLLSQSGVCYFNEIPYSKYNMNTIRQKIGIVFQDPDDQLFCSSLIDDIAFGPKNFGFTKDKIGFLVQDALFQMNLTELATMPPFQMSLGEKKRAGIATVIACDPDVIVFDEPSSNLDPKQRRNLIRWINESKKTCLIATHDLDLALDVCKRAVIFSKGKVVAEGETKTILQDKLLLEQFDLEVAPSLQNKSI